jgi:ATP-dependent DNA helicase RecG
MQKAALPPPLFSERRGDFTVTLRNGTVHMTLTPTEEQLLVFCRRPKTREQIAGFLKVKTVAYAVNGYIQPLIAKGLLKLTYPQTPRSRSQQYYSE